MPPTFGVDGVDVVVDRLVVDDHAVDDVERFGVAIDRGDTANLDLQSATRRATVVRLNDRARDLALERVLDGRCRDFVYLLGVDDRDIIRRIARRDAGRDAGNHLLLELQDVALQCHHRPSVWLAVTGDARLADSQCVARSDWTWHRPGVAR